MYTIELDMTGTQESCNRVVNAILSDDCDNALSYITMKGEPENTKLTLAADIAECTHDMLFDKKISVNPCIEYGMTGTVTSFNEYVDMEHDIEFTRADGQSHSHVVSSKTIFHGINLDLFAED